MHLISKLLTTPRLLVRPIINHAVRADGDTSLNKHNSAYDRYNYNVKNDILNKPDGFTDEAIAELETLRNKLANSLGVKADALTVRNKEGLLVGPARVRVNIGNTGLILKPMESPEDLLKAIILISNSGQIAASVEEMQVKSRCVYLITEPDATINDSADEFVVKKKLMGEILKIDTKDKQQGVLELLSFYSGSTNRMAPDLAQKLIDAKFNEVLDSPIKAKLLLSIVTDKDLDVKLKLVGYIYTGTIKYKIGDGYKLPNSDTSYKTFEELFRFIADPKNLKVLGALNEISVKAQLTDK